MTELTSEYDSSVDTSYSAKMWKSLKDMRKSKSMKKSYQHF